MIINSKSVRNTTTPVIMFCFMFFHGSIPRLQCCSFMSSLHTTWCWPETFHKLDNSRRSPERLYTITGYAPHSCVGSRNDHIRTDILNWILFLFLVFVFRMHTVEVFSCREALYWFHVFVIDDSLTSSSLFLLTARPMPRNLEKRHATTSVVCIDGGAAVTCTLVLRLCVLACHTESPLQRFLLPTGHEDPVHCCCTSWFGRFTARFSFVFPDQFGSPLHTAMLLVRLHFEFLLYSFSFVWFHLFPAMFCSIGASRFLCYNQIWLFLLCSDRTWAEESRM